MAGKHLFEYAVIRVVPRVERNEFINVGVILYCADLKFLQTMYEINEPRLRAFSSHIDIEELNASLHSYQQISVGAQGAGPIATLPIPERFRWLTATRSTVVQSSAVHGGLCDDANATLLKLYKELVLD
jgi:hypothetical protein